MRVLIPDDWDGEDWQCVTVAWPNSAKWTALLAGLLTSPTRGRWYDESSGSIVDAQQIGLEIFDRNIPFSYCSDDEMPQPSTIVEYLMGAGIVIEGGEDMGQVVTDVQVVNGKLRVFFGHCCYTDLDMTGVTIGGDITVPQPGDDDEIEIPSGSPLEVTSACAKAARVVYLVESIIDEILDGVSAADSPAVVRNNLEDRLPGIDFGSNSFLAAYAAGLNIAAQGYASETEDPDIFQRYRFEFAKLLDSSAAGVTSDEYSALKSALNTVVQSEFDLSTYPTAFSSMRTIHQNALWMIGTNDIRNQTSYIAASGDEDCSDPASDPSSPTAPLESGYFLSENFAAGVFNSSEGGTFVHHQASVLTRNIYGLLVHMTPSTPIPYACKKMDWTYGTEPFAVQADAWGNSSDHFEGDVNAGRALVFFPDTPIGEALAAQLGYEGAVKDHTGAIVSLGDYISPGVLFGYCIASGLPYAGETMTINEWRYIYKSGA